MESFPVSSESKAEEKVPQFLVYKESNVTIHCFDNLLDEIHTFILDSQNGQHWSARKELRIGLVLEEICDTKLEKTMQILSHLSKYHTLVALTLELHSIHAMLPCHSHAFIALFAVISDMIATKELKRVKFCFNALEAIHYQILTANIIKYLSFDNLKKCIAVRLNINKSLFHYWHTNPTHFNAVLSRITHTQCTSNIFLTFKHLSLHSHCLKQCIRLLGAIETNTSISSLSLKFYDNEIYEESVHSQIATDIDQTLQRSLFSQCIQTLQKKAIISDKSQMWKSFDRNMDCLSQGYNGNGNTDMSVRLDFENCEFVFPQMYIYKFVNAIVSNPNVCANVLILLCKEWKDGRLWKALQRLLSGDTTQHCVERLEIWGPFHSDSSDESEQFISDFFDEIAWNECSLQSFKIDRISLASNDFFVFKCVDLIKFGGAMMNFISIAFEMLSTNHSCLLIDAFVYKLQKMYKSQKAVQSVLSSVETFTDSRLTNDIIQTILGLCKHNHIRLEIFVDFPDINDCDTDCENIKIEFEIDYSNAQIREKLKIEGESAKLGRMERDFYFKQSLSRLFHTLFKDYNHNSGTDFDSVFDSLSQMISVGPIVLD